jgi:hypothetical protein
MCKISPTFKPSPYGADVDIVNPIVVAEKLIPGLDVAQLVVGLLSFRGVISIQSVSLIAGLVSEAD